MTGHHDEHIRQLEHSTVPLSIGSNSKAMSAQRGFDAIGNK